MPLEEFVLAALAKEGYVCVHQGDGLYSGRDGNGDAVQFTFDAECLERYAQQGVFMGRVPQLYQPGKPAFERLVQRWVDHSAFVGADRRSTAEESTAIARQWVATIAGAQFVDLRQGAGAGTVDGRVYCRTRVANAVDSYEKLLRIAVDSPLGDAVVGLSADRAMQPKAVFSKLEGVIEAAVAGDRDVQQFQSFYEQRLRSELSKTEAGDRRDKLVNDLAPSVTAEAAALEYELRGRRMLEVTYRLRSGAEHRSLIEVDGGRITQEPRRTSCEVSAVEVPEDCLETCQVTGRRGLRELMQQSDISRGYAIPEKCVTCSVTGKRILETEAERCCLTGEVAARTVLIQSDMSGRYVIPTRAAPCEVTGARVAEDELCRSIISGKRFRRDEAVQLADGVSFVHRSEAARCGVTGEWLAESETALCPETQIRAGKPHFRVCEVTSAIVLPSGLGECCLTNKKARKSLLLPSAASGKSALAEKMRRCAVSGAVLLPEEVALSEVTGKEVDARLLRRCSVTGRTGAEGELVKSAVSGEWMVPEATITMADGRPAGKHETALCEWTSRVLPIAATSECQLSGLRLDRKLLNASSEFRALREVLDGTRTGQAFPDKGFLARSFPTEFRGVTGSDYLTSVTRKAHILFGSKSFLGLNKRFFAVIAVGDLSGMRLVGRVLWGKRVRGVWTATDVVTIE